MIASAARPAVQDDPVIFVIHYFMCGRLLRIIDQVKIDIYLEFPRIMCCQATFYGVIILRIDGSAYFHRHRPQVTARDPFINCPALHIPQSPS